MAVTYDVTPVNGGANAVGTLEKTSDIAAFVIGVDSASDGTDDAPVDLRANDGSSGSMHAHGNDAASIARRLEALDGIGTDTTVTAGSAIVVS